MCVLLYYMWLHDIMNYEWFYILYVYLWVYMIMYDYIWL